MKRIAILGASGHGRVLADIATMTGWTEISFYDDSWPEKSVNRQWKILGTTKDLYENYSKYDGVIIAIGDNQIRIKKLKELLHMNAPIVSLIHPDSTISQYSEIGVGSAVMPGAVINIDVKADVGVIINTASTIDHDCNIGEGVHLSPGVNLAGNVTVGNCSWLGIGSSVKQNIKIGKNVIVGSGAVVVKDIDDNKIAIGVPAVPQ